MSNLDKAKLVSKQMGVGLHVEFRLSPRGDTTFTLTEDGLIGRGPDKVWKIGLGLLLMIIGERIIYGKESGRIIPKLKKRTTKVHILKGSIS